MASSGKPYSGNYQHNLDDKDRLTIPSDWRAEHAEGEVFMATPHPDGYISVLPPTVVAEMKAKFALVPYTDSKSQNGITRFMSASHSFVFDKQGRISLPQHLLKHAGIQRTAMLRASSNKFNIYSPEAWARIEGEGDLGDMLRSLPVSF